MPLLDEKREMSAPLLIHGVTEIGGVGLAEGSDAGGALEAADLAVGHGGVVVLFGLVTQRSETSRQVLNVCYLGPPPPIAITRGFCRKSCHV